MPPVPLLRSRASRLWRAFWPLVIVVAGAVTCDSPTALRQPGLIAVEPVLSIQSLSQFAGLTVDQVRLTAVRPPAETLARRTFAFSADSAQVRASLSVSVSGTEQIDVFIELLSGAAVVFTGSQSVSVTAGATTPPAATPIPVTYTGPGAGVAQLLVAPRDSGITFGQQVAFRVSATDSQGAAVPQFYVSWSTPAAAHTINANGVFTAGNARGTVWVRALTPTGVGDSTRLTVNPAASAVAALSGNGQSGGPGTRLGAPLVVRVTAADGLPVAGARVAFAAVTGGGAVDSAAVATDSLGRAGTTVTLGPGAGANTFTATVSGLAPVTFTATAVVAAPAAIQLSIPDTIVGVGQAPPLTVRLTQAAPAGGLVVTVTSDSTAFLTVAAPGTIAFNAGDSIRTIGLTGVASGVASIRAAAPGYTAAQLFAAVVPPFLTSAPSALTVGVAATTTFTVAPHPRPLGPLAVTIVSSDTTRARVTTPTLNFVAGQVSATATVQGVATGAAALTVSAPGYLPTASTVTVGAGVPATLQKQAGDNQSAFINDTVAIRLQARVLDAGGAPVPGVTVQFAVASGGGTIGGGAAVSGVTNASGIALAAGAWRMGPAPGANTLSATVPAVPAVAGQTFSATATLPPPQIVLSVFGSSVVGQARVGQLDVRLLQAAPAGGLTVNLATTRAGLLRIGSYPSENGSVAFAAGDTLKSITVFGDSVTTGVDTVIGTATGYTPDTLAVPISINLISLPATANVPLGQTANLPVNLSVAAPAGGLKVAVASSNPAAVQVLTDTVTIAAGSQVGSATLSGQALGSASVTATNPNYAPFTSAVSVTASLNVTQTTVGLNASFGSPITIQLESGGSPVAAPAGGVSATLTSRNPACVAAPATATIAQGFVNTQATLTYGGSATLPCSAYVVASGPAGFVSDSVNASVAVQPVISIGATNVGSGLQRPVSASLGASNHGGTTMTIVSTDSAKVRLATNDSTPGAGTIVLSYPAGSTNQTFYVQALEGFIADTVLLNATASGFVAAAPQVRVWQGLLDLQGVTSSVTTLTPPGNVYVRVGTPSSPAGTFINTLDEIRPGGPVLLARISVSDTTVARLTDTAAATTRADTALAVIRPRQTNSPATFATGGVQLSYVAQGVDTLRAGAPGFRSVAAALDAPQTVSAPTLSLGTMNLGSGLQRQGSLSLSNPAPAGGITVVIRAAPAGKLLLSTSATVPGADSVALTFAAGATTPTGGYFVQTLEGLIADTVTLTATAVAPGFTAVTPGTGQVRIWQAVVDLQGVPGSVNTLAGPGNVYVRVGTPSTATGTFINTLDEIRPGGQPLVATISLTDSTVARLADTAAVTLRADTAQVVILPGQTNSPTTLAAGGASLTYLAQGVDTLRATVPGARSVGTALNAVVTVTAPSLSMSTINLGSGLQRANGLSLSAVAPAGGVTVVIRAAPTGKVLLSANDSTPGADTLLVTIPAGATTLSGGFYVQALDGLTADTVTLTATAVAGFTAVTPATAQVRVWQAVMDLVGVPATVNTLATNSALYARIGTPSAPTGTFINTIDERRPGAAPLTVTFTTSQASVAQLETQAQSGSSVTATINARQTNTPTTRAAGGVELNYLSVGSTVVGIAAGGQRIVGTGLGDSVTVSPPTVSISNATVGIGLQLSQGGSLSSGNHTGVTVVVKSSNPAVALIAPNDTTPGTDSVVINLGAGATFFSYYLQGNEASQGGLVTVTASATGFTSSNATANVVQPVFDLSGVQTSGISAATSIDDPFVVRIGVGNQPANTFLNQLQAVRAGGTPVSVTVVTSNPSVATLVTSAGPQGGQVVLQIGPRQSSTPSTVAAGGVAHDFLTQGVTNLSASIPGFIWAQSTQPIVVPVGP